MQLCCLHGTWNVICRLVNVIVAVTNLLEELGRKLEEKLSYQLH